MALLRFLLALVVLSALALPAGAQQSTPAPSSSPSSGASHPSSVQSQQGQRSSEEILKQEEKQRALGVIPLFNMTSLHNAPPLTSRQKFQLMLKTQFDPFTFVSAGLTAAIGQETGSFQQYGEGPTGYAKRYAAAFADNTSANVFGNFVYPVLFREDPRYFRSGEGRIRHRVLYAFAQAVVTKKDAGGRTFNFSNVLAGLTAGTISNLYYPESDRGIGLTASRAAIALGYGSAGNLFLEFWPDIDRKLFHKQPPSAVAGP
ncbi:MAG TPA: carboxypeptidase regulatory-like domain-containing protein [Terriglobales bacterium]|nr:carboxypeptidase regulatory-like domain-containing protein [Terriglobales bacterium]